MRISDWSSDVCSSDLFTRTTAKGIEVVGGAAKGRAIIILNPADPPMIMRDTIFTLTDLVDESLVCDAVKAMVAEVRSEEHTSELQSLMRNSYAVFCLKKKK